MSHNFYSELWREARTALSETISTDARLCVKLHPDRKMLAASVCEICRKYASVANKLTRCSDQIVHPQKLSLVRRMLEGVIVRYLELKKVACELMLCEFISVAGDEEFEEFSLAKYFKDGRRATLRERREFIRAVNEKVSGKVSENVVEMSEEEAILMIQRHERARQCRMRAIAMKNAKELKGLEDMTDEGNYRCEEIARKACNRWKGFVIRKNIQKRIREEMILIGMSKPKFFDRRERDKADKIDAERGILQERRLLEYEKAVSREKELIYKYKSDAISDGIKDEVRAWYKFGKEQTGKFPSLPSEENGGSAALFAHPASWHAGRSVGSTSAGTSAGKGSGKKSVSGEKADKLPQREKAQETDGDGVKLAASDVLRDLQAADAEYQEIWMGMDERDNPRQYHVADIIRKEKMAEVEAELRKKVDAQMRAELENLQRALERDERGKKSGKIGKKKGKRSGKRGKKKKDKDLTPDRSPESLLEELITNGVVKNCEEIPLDFFQGSATIVVVDVGGGGKDDFPQGDAGDVRRAVRDTCVLPLMSPYIREKGPMVRSVLFAGPGGSGKNTLVHAICHETGSLLFDLTASNLAGKYPGKAGLTMLVHLVNKVSKMMQPSIIYVGDAERTFLKKVPKGDRTDPKRLKKDLPKIVRAIAPTDMVMVIGVTNAPWDCDVKSMLQTYEKVIPFSRPRYGSLRLFWSHILRKYGAESENLNVSTLAKISDGYTIGTLEKATKQLMTCKRKLQLKIRPLSMAEISDALSRQDPVYKEMEQVLAQWYAKTSVGRNRQKALELEDERLKMERDAKIIKKREQ